MSGTGFSLSLCGTILANDSDATRADGGAMDRNEFGSSRMSEDALQTPQAREALVEAAREYERAAREAELVAHHLRVVARHFRERDVPRGCAHAFAAY